MQVYLPIAEIALSLPILVGLGLAVGILSGMIGIGGGFLLQAVCGWWLMQLDLNVDMGTLMLNSLFQGIAIGVIWVPLTLATFQNIPGSSLAEATAVYHLLRNIGSSFFISICVTEIVRSTSANYSRLSEMLNPFNRMLELPWVMGAWDADSVTGLAKLSREIARQSAMLGYINAFGLYTLASALAIPLVLFVRRRATR